MSDNVAAVLITLFITIHIMMSRILMFIWDIVNLDESDRDAAKESAWDDEIV